MQSRAGLLACLTLFATPALPAPATGRAFPSYASIKFLLDAQAQQLPPDLKGADEAKWLAWARREDKAIRARLEQGDLDTLVNFLLYGVSFTKQPPLRMERLTEAAKSGTLRARVNDLAAGLRDPGSNERLMFLHELMRNQGIDPASDHGETGSFIYNQLLRVLEQRKALGERAASDTSRSSLFHDRGLSLDTTIFAAFSIDRTLRDLKQRGVLREGQVARVAVVGPGLDFIDKNEDSAYDYYPPQTLQPFALYDSLLRLGLAKQGALSIAILDISPRVIAHLQRARERAARNAGYVLQLPRNSVHPWPAELATYWGSFGKYSGDAIEPMRPPEVFAGLETRAVRINPSVVLACEPVDLNIVLERLSSPSAQFDLIVATNVFVYYDAFEQSLALENAGAMLKPGGLLLTNDRLPAISGGSMRLEGFTAVPSGSSGAAGEGIGWYRKQ